MILILLNTFTPLPTMTLGSVLITDIIVAGVISINIYNFIDSTREALSKTHEQPKFACLVGQVPIFCFFAAVWIMFKETEWAFANPALACLVLVPGFSLVSSRQIICNVTQMDSDPVPKTFLWFILFHFNRHAPHHFRKCDLTDF
jgi:hypothetical protein